VLEALRQDRAMGAQEISADGVVDRNLKGQKGRVNGILWGALLL